MSKIIKQKVAVKAEPKEIFRELNLWAKSRWWPKILIRFKDMPQDLSQGSVYLQKVNLPFGPKWRTKNTLIKPNTFYIQRTFIDGIFDGFEELTVKPGEEASEVTYCFHYIIRGFLNKLLWEGFFKRVSIKNINLALNSLKKYLEKK